jgi:hypothetical protein
MVGSTLVVTGIEPVLHAYAAWDGKPAGDSPTLGEVVAAPYVATGTSDGLPKLLVLTRHISAGTIAELKTRDIEPRIVPLTPLANPIPLAPLPRPAD